MSPPACSGRNDLRPTPRSALERRGDAAARRPYPAKRIQGVPGNISEVAGSTALLKVQLFVAACVSTGYAWRSMLRRRQSLKCLIALATSAMLSVVALDWQQQPGHRRAALAIATGGKAGFTQVEAAAAGIAFTNRLSEDRSLTNQIFLNGSGVAVGDIDGDGLCDIYFCGLDSPNALYRNLGNWHFADITTAAGVACADQASTGAAFADVDGDGHLDLLVNGIAHGTRLFLNDGKGRFSEVTTRS